MVPDYGSPGLDDSITQNPEVSAVNVGKRDKKHKIGFPDLPGEIFNYIYELLAGNVKRRNQKRMRIRVLLVPQDYDCLLIATEDSWKTLKRQDLGVFQSHRQIRAEHMPLYFAGLQQVLPLPQLLFHLKKTPRLLPLDLPPGQIIVRVHRDFLAGDEYRGDAIDIAPLLRAYIHSPNIHLSERNFDYAARQLGILFNTKENAAWRDRVREDSNQHLVHQRQWAIRRIQSRDLDHAPASERLDTVMQDKLTEG